MRTSINLAMSLIRVIVVRLKFKQAGEQIELAAQQAEFEAKASRRIKAGAARGRSGQAAGRLATNRLWLQSFSKLAIRLLPGLLVATMVVLWSSGRVARVDSSQGTISTGANPTAIAVNPVTNRIYVANTGGVTVIDGSNNTTTTIVTAGNNPFAIAVNPATNKIYVANQNSDNVTVIDGSNNTTTTVAAGDAPTAVAINLVTNKIYVANVSSANVTVIDGSNNTTATVAAGTGAQTVAVNPVTNKIYVGNQTSVTVIDGSNNTPVTIPLVGSFSVLSIAVNPVTNKIYAAYLSGGGFGLVAVIDGSDNTTETVTTEVLGEPKAIGVNPVTNKIYVTSDSSDVVTVIDGIDNTTTPVPVGDAPRALALNPFTNKIYVGNLGSDNVTVIDGANNTTTTVAAGTDPTAVAVNPVTNKSYVANSLSNNVTVIDGSNNTTATVAGVTAPIAVAVNTVTNKIYVVNQVPATGSVTVIDGINNTTAIVAAGPFPVAIAVNSVTNKIYVANNTASVTVIDGVNNSTATVTTLSGCRDIAVNPVTNKIYVSIGGGRVTVINGSDNTTAIVAVGADPLGVAVNSATNKIYVANNNGNTVTVINGSDNTTATVAAGTGPIDIAVNSVTNKIYVANQTSNNVTVINGSDNTTATVAAGTLPITLAVNSVTNRIYVVNQTSNNVTVVNGSDNTTATVAVGTTPRAVAVNSVTNKIYVANGGSNNVTVIDGSDNTTTTAAAGTNPRAVAINSDTNKIYVGNGTSNNMTVINGSDNTTMTIAEGVFPRAIAVNPVTNKIYVANVTNSVTVIDGSNTPAPPVAAGTNPQAVAVNPATNKIYVANQSSNNVTVINGSDNTTATVAVGTGPIDIAVNPVTNRIYVANNGSDNVTVINGSDNTTATVAAGDAPQALAINPVTNKIYVANAGISNNVTVINGSDNTTVTVAAGTLPRAVAVNPVTNKIYVANQTSANVTVINGINNTTTTVAAGTTPRAVAVNPITNKIYVANNGSDNVTVINGSDNTTATVSVGDAPQAIAVNPVINKIYVPSSGTANNVTVIDGINNTTATVAALAGPLVVAINPATGKIYVGNSGISSVTVITPVATQAIPLTVAIAPLANDLTISPTPTFNFTATSAFTPTAPPVTQIYYQVDTWTGTWLKASPGGAAASGPAPPLQAGTHIIYAFAGDGQEATSVNGSPNSGPLIGQISAYMFHVVLPTMVSVNSFPNPSLAGQPVTLLASVIASDTTPLTGGTVQFKDGGINLGSPVAVSNGAAALLIDSLAVGAHTITAVYTGTIATFNATSSNSVIQNVTNTTTWTGATSSDWNTASNWSTNFAPTSLTNVTIPASGVTNEPAINAANINVNNLTLATGRTLTIAASRTLTINGTASISGTIAGAGTLLQTGPTLTNDGQITVASALFGGASQTVNGIGAFAGNNTFIVLSGASVTLGNNFSLVNVYVSSGGSLNISSFAISVSGAGTALQADGLLTTTGSTIIYNGIAAQSTAPANVSYNNLTIANSAGVNLSTDTTVTGVLALTSGDLNTGAFTLTMPASATSSGSGDVIGSVKRTGFTVGAALSFGNPFNTIRFDTGTAPTDVTVNLDKNVPTTPAPFPQAIARKYTITPTGGSGYTATLRFHYQDGELNGNSEGMNLKLWRYDGTNWVSVGQSAFDTTANWVEKSGVTQFSPWTMNSTVPTAAGLESCIATSYDGGVLIEWQSGFEVNNLGFNLYRDEAGKRLRVNPHLVAGSALLAGANTVLRAGRAYSFWDSNATNKAAGSYWLEDVDLNGQSTWHGPYLSKRVGGSAPVRRNSPFIGQSTLSQVGVTRQVEQAAALQGMKPEQVTLQAALAGQGAVKLWVKREGWHRVTAAELAQAGLDPKANAASLQLYVDGQQVPINVNTDKQGRLVAIDFYGRGIDAAFTDQRAYWLIRGAQPGLRIPQVKADGYPAAAASFLYTVERKDRTIYFSGLRNGEQENFFGAVIAGQPVDQTMTIAHVDQPAIGAATLKVALQGVTLLQHRVWVYLNGAFAGELFFNGQAEGVASFSVPQSLLKSGDNEVKLVAQGGPSDISLVDYIQLTYWHRFAAEDDALRFTATGNQAVTISGFTSGEIRVFDVTDPDSVQELATTIERQKTGYAVTATSPGAAERRLMAIADAQAIKPARIAPDHISNWRNSANGADLIVISGQDLSSSLQPLVALRQSQGLKVALVDIEDIYDEFSFGNKSPQAVKDFLAYAKTTWKKTPGYVLLAGDATYDAKNYLGFGEQDLVPTKLVDTQLMEAASDDWLADFDGDGIADLAMGRLPGRSTEELGAMVKKIIRYERAEASGSMLLVADSNEGFDFEAAANRLHALIPDDLRVVQINRGQMEAGEARKRLLEAIAQGQKVINYTGHGSANQWHGGLLTNQDVGNLTNGERMPVFVMMTCLNGYFDDPALDSLAESLMKVEGGGAVAVWASSGMTLPDAQSQMNEQLYRLLFGSNGQAMRLGDAAGRAKSAIGDGDIRRTWVLLGDPTMRLK